ncbi:estradiol 17-beta-dehydrogenase 11 isoform X2 [Megachile rotundata]|uniref:estradiol 17-beta-dehydrogenase 11 isoform X2 n=1 Tax=Megachile rotundata TaxID=143995 RepID=UPI003FD293C5
MILWFLHRESACQDAMLFTTDKSLMVNPKMEYPSTNFWVFFTVEFLMGVLLSGFLAILKIVKSSLPKPPRDLTGDVVVIAGATSSLGESLAGEFARNRCTVVCMDNDSKLVDETVCRLQKNYHAIQEIPPKHKTDDSLEHDATIIPYRCDLLDKNDIRRTAEKIKEDVGRVDILITCVGNPNQDIFDTASRTLMSHFWTVMTFLPLLLCRKRAHIVGVTPVVSNEDAYHGSRAAIAGLMESLWEVLGNHSGQLTFLAFSPIAQCRTLKQSEERIARNIVRAVRTDQSTLNSSWISRFLYQTSCVIHYGITLLTQWIHSHRCGDSR